VSLPLVGYEEANSHVGEPYLARNWGQPLEANSSKTTRTTTTRDKKTPEALRPTASKSRILPIAMQAGKWILLQLRHNNENPVLGSILNETL